jgi:hypothetical protein
MPNIVVNGSDDSKKMNIDHCVMVKCATNAMHHYYMLKSQMENKRKHVVDLEQELREAKDDLEQICIELQSQKTTICVLQKLCNHEDVTVLKGEDGMKKDVIDLCSGDDVWNDMDESEAIGYANGANDKEESNHVTPVKGRKRCKN